MKDQEYIEILRRIPHLDLTSVVPTVPLEEIRKEFEQEKHNVSPFEYGVDTDKNPDLIPLVTYLMRHWQGFGVIDITSRGDHFIDYLKEDVNHEYIKSLGVEFDENGFGIYKPTDIGQRMIETVKYVYTLFKKVGRVRFSFVKPNGVIGYHNHEVKSLVDRKKMLKPLTAEGINSNAIHVPIYDNPGSCHIVTKGSGKDYVNADRFYLPDGAIEYKQHYSPGEVWMFNCVHYHKAVNFGNTDRVHLLCYFDHMDENIRPYIEKAIELYKGPFIE